MSTVLTDSSFEEVVKSNPKVLVDFWAEWCGPCRMLSPILEDIENETGLLIGKLNVDENPVKSKEYSVSSIPTMILFVDGVPVKTMIGAKPKHALMKDLEEWI